MDCEVYPLFPIAIGKFKRDNPLTKSELRFVEEYEYGPNSKNDIGEDKHLFKNSQELSDIHQFCQLALNTYVNSIYESDVNFTITTSWLNKTKPEQSHHRHAHQNSVFSGVFYFQDQNEAPPINFYASDFSLVEQWDLNPRNYNLFNSSKWEFPIEKNTCIIFPSTLSHSVPKNTLNTSRYSIAFNTFLSTNQTLGSVDKATVLCM
jgi:uncharacterized protein (TIGR02466 family)